MSRTGGVAALSVMIALSLAFFATSARAVDAAQPIRIRYTAPPGCPNSLQFFWLVRSRTDRVRLAAVTELAVPISVDLLPNATGVVGTLGLPPVGGELFQRRVEARSCAEVVVALSLIVALAFDPDAASAVPAPAAHFP